MPVRRKKKSGVPDDDVGRLQLLIDSVVDYAIYMIDLDGRIASWNPGAARLKGYRAEEIIGQPYAKFFTPEDQAQEFPRRALATAAQTGRFESEGWRVRADGTRFWALAVIDAVRDHDGNLIGFAKVTRDMTDRRLEQTKLLESERRFRLLVQSVVDYAIFQLDRDGIVSSWNAGAERIKGYTADEDPRPALQPVLYRGGPGRGRSRAGFGDSIKGRKV